MKRKLRFQSAVLFAIAATVNILIFLVGTPIQAFKGPSALGAHFRVFGLTLEQLAARVLTPFWRKQ